MLSKAARLAARKRRQISAPPHAVAHHQRGIGLRFAKLMKSGRGAWLAFLAVLGPGLLAGLSDDDPAGITTYSVLGADFGYTLDAEARGTLQPGQTVVEATSGNTGNATQTQTHGHLYSTTTDISYDTTDHCVPASQTQEAVDRALFPGDVLFTEVNLAALVRGWCLGRSLTTGGVG